MIQLKRGLLYLYMTSILAVAGYMVIENIKAIQSHSTQRSCK
jgi:hypothetical protein